MLHDFTYHYKIIYDKFTSLLLSQGKKPSVLALGNFLGHGHDGRVKAWKKGQWPSAEDCWTLEKKLGFNLRWLVTGEGDPFDAQPKSPAEKCPHTNPAALPGQPQSEERLRELKYTIELQKKLLEAYEQGFVGNKIALGADSAVLTSHQGNEPHP